MTTIAGVSITNPERLVFPAEGLTKLDVARWFNRIAPRMLPHVADRPLAFVRCPEGLAGECFFQKHWTGRRPGALNVVSVRQADGRRREHVVVRDAAGLVTLAQWGVLEIHTWGAQAGALESPDRLIFDLDPGPGTTWAAVRSGAAAIRQVLSALGLASWVKTTGGKGLHVVVPVARKIDWAEASGFCRSVAERIEAAAPDRYVSEASKAKRQGKVFIDWLRNARGATAIAPWSPRARAEAGVATPIPWTRLPKTTAGDEWRLPQLLGRRLSADPWRGLLASKQSLAPKAIDAVRARPRSG